MNSTELRRPRLKAPAGTTDTHIHIYDHRYPTAKTASFTPPDALLAEYREVCALVGIERTIVVQPTTYGSDHRCTLEAIAALGMQVQLGGGLRTRAAVERALGFGVSRVVIGTRAAESEAFVGELVQSFGEKIAVGIDAKNGQVAVKGWVATADLSALALARRMDALGVRTLIHTDIGTDGMLTGPNFPAQEAMLAAGKFNVIASGGVSRREDVVKLAELTRRYANLEGVIVGKALYERRVELGDLLAVAASAK